MGTLRAITCIELICLGEPVGGAFIRVAYANITPVRIEDGCPPELIAHGEAGM